MIRVSVVATGVDQNVAMMSTETLGRAADSHSAAHETRIAELAPRLRAENKRIAERLERIDHSTQASQFAAAAPETEQEDFNRSALFEASIDAVATAAVATAALFEREIDDVTIRPIPPKATFLAQSMAAEEESCELPPPAVFIPARPKWPARRPRR
ncbi:MAG: cell division protein FtsZ, partial [Rhodoplanes sp.]